MSVLQWFTYQNIGRWFCDCRKNVDTFRRKVSALTGARALTKAPAGVLEHLTIVLIEDHQVALLETQKRCSIS